MKPCPFCAEEIQDAAVKCRFCGSMLTGAAAPPQETAPALLFEGTPSWKGQLGEHLLAGLLVAGGVAAGLLLWGPFAQEPPVTLGVSALLVLLGVVWALVLWVRRFVHYRISTRSIDIESGLIGKRIETLQLWKIRDVGYEQSLLDRLLGLAKIRIFTQDVSSPELVIWGLSGSREVFEQLKRAIELARQSRNVVGLVE